MKSWYRKDISPVRFSLGIGLGRLSRLDRVGPEVPENVGPDPLHGLLGHSEPKRDVLDAAFVGHGQQCSSEYLVGSVALEHVPDDSRRKSIEHFSRFRVGCVDLITQFLYRVHDRGTGGRVSHVFLLSRQY